jgi:hypothetical protein
LKVKKIITFIIVVGLMIIVFGRCSKKRLKSLASELHTFKVPKQEIGFDLEECEMIAKEIDA